MPQVVLERGTKPFFLILNPSGRTHHSTILNFRAQKNGDSSHTRSELASFKYPTASSLFFCWIMVVKSRGRTGKSIKNIYRFELLLNTTLNILFGYFSNPRATSFFVADGSLFQTFSRSSTVLLSFNEGWYSEF